MCAQDGVRNTERACPRGGTQPCVEWSRGAGGGGKRGPSLLRAEGDAEGRAGPSVPRAPVDVAASARPRGWLRRSVFRLDRCGDVWLPPPRGLALRVASELRTPNSVGATRNPRGGVLFFSRRLFIILEMAECINF